MKTGALRFKIAFFLVRYGSVEFGSVKFRFGSGTVRVRLGSCLCRTSVSYITCLFAYFVLLNCLVPTFKSRVFSSVVKIKRKDLFFVI